VLIRFSDAQSATQLLFGSIKTTAPTGGFYIIPRNAGTANVQYANGTFAVSTTTPPPVLVSGVLGFAAKKAYRNGTAESIDISAGSGAYSTYGMFLGNANADGVPLAGLFFGGKIQAFVHYNTTLDATQMAAVSAAMAAL